MSISATPNFLAGVKSSGSQLEKALLQIMRNLLLASPPHVLSKESFNG
jgi:hypothetical protein